jgi:hypothetical protein
MSATGESKTTSFTETFLSTWVSPETSDKQSKDRDTIIRFLIGEINRKIVPIT